MIKQIEISIPQGYADITLKRYLDLQRELKNYEGEEEAEVAVLITYLCNIDADILKGLGREDYITINNELSKWLSNTEFELQRFITIDGIEYGFEPNLSNISYGAYADITRYDTIQIDENWAKIMSILYRPVVKKGIGDTYEIETYNGIGDEKKWLNVSMDKHFGCLFFFVRLSTDLLKSTLKSTMGMDLPPHIKSTLARSGEIIQQLWNSPTKI